MVKIEELRRLLNVREEEIKKLDIEQLRLMLGIFRYLTRIVEREINQRKPDARNFLQHLK